ncbi:MAG: SMI1/KNR4 family protein [Bacteroidetes bacterium]|jgi:SMI1 / KNR4 family.|nr:MAG: SMI1/KNR4 family protein [Bacteroidota bacterium]
MDSGTIEKINDFFTANPIAKGIPSSREEIINAENELGIKFDKDYVFFLLNYGGSLIKEKEIYGLRNSEMMGDDDIINLTKVFRENESENNDWLIIGTDYAGNPVGIDKDGKVLMLDYDFGGCNVLGESFEDYILKSLDD